MSSPKTITLQEFIQIITEEAYLNIISHHLLYAGLTIMVWDSLLTLDKEIDLVWRRKLTLGSYFYIFSRYGTLASLFISSFADFVRVGRSCVGYEIPSIIFSILSTHAFFGQFIARAYAISGNRKLVLVVLFPIELARFINNIVTIPTVISICLKNNNLPPSLLRKFQIEGDIQAALNIATQVLCFVITVYHTFGTWRRFKRTSRLKSFSVLIFEQGIYEFGLMVVLVITINVMIHTLPDNVGEFANAAPLNISLPTVLLSRFFLALRLRNAPVMQEVEAKYPSSLQGSWKSSQDKLLAEFGEASIGTRTSSVSYSRFHRESIPMDTFEFVTVGDSHPYNVSIADEELADDAEVDATTPLNINPTQHQPSINGLE